MKLSLVALTALAGLSSAWKLTLTASDGRKAEMHGKLKSDCVNIEFTPALNVKRAVYDPSTPLLPDPDTFELYVNKGCNGLSYRSNKGTHNMTPRVIRSYKVL